MRRTMFKECQDWKYFVLFAPKNKYGKAGLYQVSSSKLFVPVFLTVNSPGNLFLVLHFDLVSLSRYTSEPHCPADRNLCRKMELSLFTGFIFVSTALERPLLYGWTYDSDSLQHDHLSTSLMNASTLESNVRDEPEVSQRPRSFVSPAEYLTLRGGHSIFTFCPILKYPPGLLLSFSPCCDEEPRQHWNSNYHAKTCPGCLLF